MLLLAQAASSAPAEYVDKATQWLVENGANLAMRLLGAVILYVVGKVIIGIALTLTEKSLNRTTNLKPLLRSFIQGSVKNVLWIVLWVMLLAQLGVEVGPIVASLGVAGFVLGFAFQNTLSNFAAGLMLLANSPFEAGDFVEAAGHMGTVKELNLMATTLASPDNKRITLPNSTVWGAPIVNYSVLGTRRVEIKLSISYGSDINKAKQIVQELMKADARVLQDPAPMCEVLAHGSSSIDLVARPWTKVADYWGVFFELNQKIKEGFDQNGIEIPFPQMVLHQPKAKA
ncbi:mechanosensitive ion channel [bacterium]|nr:mechanosensitive ion channel [bacterium]